MTVNEYLLTSWPDLVKEYRYGELIDRGDPDLPHSTTHGKLAFAFHDRPCDVLMSLRMRLAPELYRVGDVVVSLEPQSEMYPSTPPLLVAEVLARDQSFVSIRQKLDDYHRWGVKHIWLADPHSRHLYTCDGILREVRLLRLAELDVELGPADVFEE